MDESSSAGFARSGTRRRPERAWPGGLKFLPYILGMGFTEQTFSHKQEPFLLIILPEESLMSKTDTNLMDAFAGESQANRKYLAYAKQAEKEGLPQAARLFRAAAGAETIHAHAHLRLAGKIGTTMDNLKDALAGETHEFTHMYPEMIKDAEAEGRKAVLQYFGFVNAVEGEHADLYKKMLENGGKGPAVEYYICTVCGYTHEGPCTDKCPVCKAAASAFVKSE
jgi:rubrerythrin